MAGEFETRIIMDFPSDIAGRLNEAALLAHTADGFGRQGQAEHAFQSLLEIDPTLSFKATIKQPGS